MELVKTISAVAQHATATTTRSRNTSWWERMNMSCPSDNPGYVSRWKAPKTVHETVGSSTVLKGYSLRLNGRDVGKLNPGVEDQVRAVQAAMAEGKQIEVEYIKGDLAVRVVSVDQVISAGQEGGREVNGEIQIKTVEPELPEIYNRHLNTIGDYGGSFTVSRETAREIVISMFGVNSEMAGWFCNENGSQANISRHGEPE